MIFNPTSFRAFYDSASVPPAHSDGLDALKERCARKGIRITPIRLFILNIMNQKNVHVITIAQLVDAIRKHRPQASATSVYSAVRAFEKANILTRHLFNDGVARYELNVLAHHDHLVDIDTGEVIDFHDNQIEEIQKSIAQSMGYELVGHRLFLYGKNRSV